VGGNAHAAAKGFDRPRSDSYPNFLAEQMMRHRVVVLVDLDVIVDLDLSFAAVAAVGASSTKTRVKPPSPSKVPLDLLAGFPGLCDRGIEVGAADFTRHSGTASIRCNKSSIERSLVRATIAASQFVSYFNNSQDPPHRNSSREGCHRQLWAAALTRRST
jgi:hypothetical protein